MLAERQGGVWLHNWLLQFCRGILRDPFVVLRETKECLQTFQLLHDRQTLIAPRQAEPPHHFSSTGESIPLADEQQALSRGKRTDLTGQLPVFAESRFLEFTGFDLSEKVRAHSLKSDGPRFGFRFHWLHLAS